MTRSVLLGSLVWLLIPLSTVWAENEGQADLDKATEIQLQAQTLQESEQVVKLAESALQKGLDEENTKFARQLITSSLWQRASRLASEIFDAPRPSPRWPALRKEILATLERLLKHDPAFADALVLTAKLQILPRGNVAQAKEAIDKAAEIYKDDKPKLAETLVLRATLRQKPEEQLADLDAAIAADATNAKAWQARAAYHISRNEFDKAIEDFQSILSRDPNNLGIRQALVEALTNLEKFDLALEQANKAVELQPQVAMNYTLRARVHERQDHFDKAIADLDEALKVDPQDLVARYMRARMHLAADHFREATEDLNKFLQEQPGSAQGILLRSMVAAAEKRFHEAISDIQLLLRADPQNVELRMQLGSLHVADQRPRKAIEIFDALIEEDKENWAAYRSRGDALLSIGKQKDAVADYESALKLQPENDGILNNLAWVLATSPDDSVRNGARSVELGTKACELTKFQMPHILSTLAAGYAESGDFENAIKWSTKAVELGREKLKDQIEQLEKELDSYKSKKPWRELQQVEDKPTPSRRVIDT